MEPARSEGALPLPGENSTGGTSPFVGWAVLRSGSSVPRPGKMWPRHGGFSIMTTQGRLAAILTALTFFGCKGPLQASAASAVDGAGSASSGEGATTASGSGGAPRKEYVTDPTLNNMNAFDVTIPARWHFQGTLFQGGNCTSLPFGVWRATSPDGLSKAERLPALAWVWGTGPMIGFMPKKDCLPLKGPMSAQEFLKYLAAIMKVEYVSDEPVPAELNAKAQKELRDAEAVYAPQ